MLNWNVAMLTLVQMLSSEKRGTPFSAGMTAQYQFPLISYDLEGEKKKKEEKNETHEDHEVKNKK